jgi:hypothetical protein
MASDHPPSWLWVLTGSAGAAQMRRHGSEVVATHVYAWTVDVTLPRFRLKADASRTWASEYGKPLIDPVGSHPRDGSCAEVEVTKMFRDAGWDAWWSDGFGAAPRRWRPWIRRPGEWEGSVAEVLRDVRARRHDARQGGVPDVIGVRGSELLLVECKGRDSFRKTQLGWLEAALSLGLDGNTFAVCQFSLQDAGYARRIAAADLHTLPR